MFPVQSRKIGLPVRRTSRANYKLQVQCDISVVPSN